MIKIKKAVFLLPILTAAILLSTYGCKKESSPAQKTTYNMMVKDVLGVSGTVTFTENSSTSTIIDIVLLNAPTGSHPANLYMNSVVENGTVTIALNPVDASGKSSTMVNNMNYATLTAYNGCIKVSSSAIEPSIILAQCDIGGNVLTSNNKSYNLSPIGAFGVSGTALFEKRMNGNTLLTISLTGVIPGDTYPATVNLGSITSVGGGPVVKTLSNVNGTTGKSYTNIEKLDGGTSITYENWLAYDGYLNIYISPIALENVICHGNIGAN